MNFIRDLINNGGFKLFLVVIVWDILFGILRAIKERSLNSTIGIDGMIRKTGMIISLIFLEYIDSLLHFNFIGFLPEEIRIALKFDEIGISELFNLLFIIFEMLSILKNAVLCKLPIPKGIQEKLENAMKNFTSEIKEKEE